MKDLIVQALNEAFDSFQKRIPQTKVKVVEVCIMDVRPVDLADFMKDNNIPSTAYFCGKDNGDDGYSDFCLCHDINIPTTEKDKLEFSRRAFSTPAFQSVFRSLTLNGYKRVGYNSSLMKQFDKTTVYDMYVNKDFDRLVEYYSLSFIK